MYESFGASEVGTTGVAEFKLFLPDNALDPLQYSGGGQPRIQRIRAIGEFQAKPWDIATGLELQKTNYLNKGWLFSGRSQELSEGFYQYKYYVEFEQAAPRYVGDPCTKYGGSVNQNAGFVIDRRDDFVVDLMTGGRPPLRDLVLYEIMLDDFTSEFRGDRAPLDALIDKIPYLQKLGVNAVELMPWTAWPSNDFNWGYEPYAYFSVAHRYTLDPSDPTNKLVYLKKFIHECHKNKIAVIMDGVFNHVQKDPGTAGFAYYHLYEEVADCPYVGNFMAHDFATDLDFANFCTLQLILDVCKYWISVFKIDGIRFDNTKGFYDADRRDLGLTRLLSELRNYFSDPTLDPSIDRSNFNTTLEHSWDFDAIDVVNRVAATSCWYDPSRSAAREMLSSRTIDRSLMRVLNASRDFGSDHLGTAYVENHDHATLMQHAGSRQEWWRTQPWMIALFTMPSAPLVHNAQEWGQMEWFPEMGDESPGNPRVAPRPLHWAQAQDSFGMALGEKYRFLIQLRKNHPGLRAPGFYPQDWQSGWLDADGFGIDEQRQLAVYHRYGPAEGQTEYFIIALNFSQQDQFTSLHFPFNGDWTDLLTNSKIAVSTFEYGVLVPSNWGTVYWLKR